jgi:hypothetical protein
MKNLVFIFIAILLPVISCSPSPMDTPVKASSMTEYVRSVTELHKHMDKYDQKDFMAAIETLSGDSFKAASMSLLTADFGVSAGNRQIILDAIGQFDNKTPRQIIAAAERKKSGDDDPFGETAKAVEPPPDEPAAAPAPPAQRDIERHRRVGRQQWNAWAQTLRAEARVLSEGESLETMAIDGSPIVLTRDNVEQVIAAHPYQPGV